MTTEQAYIEGFVKRAAEYGFNDEEAFEILKEAAKKGAPKAEPGFKNDLKRWANNIKANAEIAGAPTEIKLREGAKKLKEKMREGATSSKDKLKNIASKGLKTIGRFKR
jgi:hypothetical protein